MALRYVLNNLPQITQLFSEEPGFEPKQSAPATYT